MLIGSVVSGVIEVFIPTRVIDKIIQKNSFAAFSGAGLGFFIPVCECAIVPVVRRLLLKGVPVPGAIAFMLAAPTLNPIVIWSTSVAYSGDWFIVFSRVFFGFFIASFCAFFIGLFLKNNEALQTTHSLDDHGEHGQGCGCGHTHEHHGHTVGTDSQRVAFSKRLLSSIAHARDDFLLVGPFLVLGTFIAALIRSSIPLSAIESLADNAFMTIGSMMGFAFALNLCSEADAFIAATFAGIISLSGQMAFMVLGPMLDIKLLFMYKSVFTKKFIVLTTASVIVSVFVAMYFYQIIFNL